MPPRLLDASVVAGTQIEAARPHTTANGSSYADYAPRAPSFYMERTKEWVQKARSARGCDALNKLDDAQKPVREEL